MIPNITSEERDYWDRKMAAHQRRFRRQARWIIFKRCLPLLGIIAVLIGGYLVIGMVSGPTPDPVEKVLSDTLKGFPDHSQIQEPVNYAFNPYHFHWTLTDSGLYLTDSVPADGIGIMRLSSYPMRFRHGRYEVIVQKLPESLYLAPGSWFMNSYPGDQYIRTSELMPGDTVLVDSVWDKVARKKKRDHFGNPFRLGPWTMGDPLPKTRDTGGCSNLNYDSLVYRFMDTTIRQKERRDSL